MTRATRRSNAWYEAICTQLHAAGGPLAVDQIWQGMVATDFQHASERPRRTLCARIAELRQMGRLSRVGPATYRLRDAHALGTDRLEEAS